ncbi:ABC transporter ATP-binding protein/permease [Nocardioides jensenii]|uniref:ABC transporter ATP-binding protein/permease n=1 Tax=Nocardioides jensenii TaxID=1843 RepID=UPI00082D47EB|nr:ABC transporter ATP-binding protein/permease [Nocardioides jensenii]
MTGSEPGPEAAGLPRLLVGARRRRFAQLVASGLGQATLVVLTAFLMPVVLAARDTTSRMTAVAVLGAGALVLGILRYQERVLAERLGQDYVQEIRTGLVASSLAETGPNVGITVARTTNDLNSVRNWIALGITPLVVGVPVILGTVVALWILHPMLVLAVGLPLAALGIVLAMLAVPQYERSRELRRLRGGLAARVSDTVHASESIRAGGGARREVRRIASRGQQVADASVARARIGGLIRGSAITTTGLASVAVAAVGVWAGLPGATVATALTVVGVLTGPVNELGRVVEYRQSYRAARRIIGPALVVAARPSGRTTWQRVKSAEPGLVIRGVSVDGTPVPDLDARAGDVIVLRSTRAERTAAVAGALAGLSDAVVGQVILDGVELLDLAGERRRSLVGHGAAGTPFERGSVARLVRYQRPTCREPIDAVLARVGLTCRVAGLHQGERTQLRRGGQPLMAPEQAQLRLARALYGDPPLVVLDHLDDQLGAGHLRHLRRAIREYAGILVVRSDDPDAFLEDYRVWRLDTDGQEARVARSSFVESRSR